MVPVDLSCLSNCFNIDDTDDAYLKMAEIQRECSKIGLDRQIPTHMSEGLELVKSNYTLIVPWYQYRIPITLPLNPNLDCLVFHETQERKGCSTKNGVCNYVADQSFNVQRTGQTGLNNRLDYSVNTNITKVTENYKYKYLPASNPVTRAIEVCALAEMIQFHTVHNYLGPFTPHSDLFSGGPPTCDHFMPDIFGSLCSCVGSCTTGEFSDPADSNRDPPPNLILHFQTNEGLWGCQDACKKTENCEFYTHSKVASFNSAFYAEKPDFPLFQCFLWKSCDNFTLPFDGMFPFSGNTISDNWSGPRDCSRFKQKCPIFWSEGEQQDPPDGYKYTQCFLDGVKGDKKIQLQRSLDARSFEDPCRFCTERGEVCGYEVSL